MTVRLSLDQVLAQAAKLPALPQIVAQIIDMLGDEEASVESLSTHIVSDPAIVARLLAAANAGALGTGGRITSVRQAIKAAPPFDAHRLWLHSVGVAVCAQDVARIAGLDPDIAYTAGLLHDIGQLLLFAVNPAAYGLMLTQQAARDMDIVEAERECLGLDHAHVGGELARLWKLPEAVADAIAAHHVSEQNQPESELADAVHVAEVLSYALDLGGFGDARVPNLSILSCARMGIDWRSFADHFPRIEARFATARITLGL